MKNWLFKHSRATLEEWARALKIFRFVGMYGGFAQDDDEFLALVKVSGPDDLVSILKTLQAECNETLGWTRILGEDAFLFIRPEGLSIKAGTNQENPWFSAESTFAKTFVLDRKLANLDLTFIDPPSKSDLCVCPALYPQFWEDGV